jgi:hypothetical protein
LAFRIHPPTPSQKSYISIVIFDVNASVGKLALKSQKLLAFDSISFDEYEVVEWRIDFEGAPRTSFSKFLFRRCEKWNKLGKSSFDFGPRDHPGTGEGVEISDPEMACALVPFENLPISPEILT